MMNKINGLFRPDRSEPDEKLRPRIRRASGRDPALAKVPRGARGRPPKWLTPPPKAGRGASYTAPSASPVDRSRRVIAKLSYVRRGSNYAGKVAGNAKYLARREALDEGHERYLAREGPFFTARGEGYTAGKIAAACKDDPRQFRLILSPNDGERIEDMTGFVRDYMGRIERAVGARLAWAAVVHKAETVAHQENRHAHIIIRGRDLDGREVRFAPAFVKEGFRGIAEKLATERLGPMTDRELARLREQGERNRERAAELRRMDREGRAMADKRALSREHRRGRQRTAARGREI